MLPRPAATFTNTTFVWPACVSGGQPSVFPCCMMADKSAWPCLLALHAAPTLTHGVAAVVLQETLRVCWSVYMPHTLICL